MKPLPSDLKCPRCESESITWEGEWFVFCLECGAMPNEEGYETRANAVSAFRRMMARGWSVEAERCYNKDRNGDPVIPWVPAAAGTTEGEGES